MWLLRVFTEISDATTSEHIEERGERERSKTVLFVLSATSLDTPPAAVPIRLFLWGGAPPRTASLAMPTSSVGGRRVIASKAVSTGVKSMLRSFLLDPSNSGSRTKEFCLKKSEILISA